MEAEEEDEQEDNKKGCKTREGQEGRMSENVVDRRRDKWDIQEGEGRGEYL